MVKINHKQFIIMALLSENPQGSHPYFIESLIQERNMREWTNIGKSSIYRIFNELEEENLVQSFNEEVDGRIRRVYSLTSDGWKILKQKIFNVLSNFLSSKEEDRDRFGDEDFYIGFSYMGHLDKPKQVEAMNLSIKRMEDRIKYLQNGLDSNKTSPFFVRGLFLHPIMILKTDIEFFKLTLEMIEQGEMNF